MAIHIAKTQHKPRVLLIPSAALEPLEQLDVIWQVLNCIEEPIGLQLRGNHSACRSIQGWNVQAM